MGDEVKITVIATGFRQDESRPADSKARRERMLAGSRLPTLSFDAPAMQREIPIVSRVAAVRAQFEDEAEARRRMTAPVAPIHAEEIDAELIEAEHIAAPPLHAAPILVEPIVVADISEDDGDHDPADSGGDQEMSQLLVGSGHADEPDSEIPYEPSQERELELIPVPRSVFDDDFFRVPARELLAPGPAPQSAPESRMPSARGFDSPDSTRPLRTQYEDANRALDSVLDSAVAEPAVRVPVFSGPAAGEPAGADELDIPAFLRRGHP